MKKKTKTVEGEYRGIKWESPEELAFLQWAFELVDAGYIESVERAKSFILAEPLQAEYTKITQLKTRVKEEAKTETLLRGHIYTPEYRIVWNSDKYERFVNDTFDFIGRKSKVTQPFINTFERLGQRITYIEVKPNFDQQNMTRLFVINQKWMWEKHKVFVNKVIPQELFEVTFTPQAYLKTPTGKDRIITKWKVKSLNEFINESNN